ncbi:hypothetical protein BDR26DRAFT_898858 [Obelidium mucronatum]|nr:hypothetical protein BDR26DRAFT_898858 [Obelidium mucronatum]
MPMDLSSTQNSSLDGYINKFTNNGTTNLPQPKQQSHAGKCLKVFRNSGKIAFGIGLELGHHANGVHLVSDTCKNSTKCTDIFNWVYKNQIHAILSCLLLVGCHPDADRELESSIKKMRANNPLAAETMKHLGGFTFGYIAKNVQIPSHSDTQNSDLVPCVMFYDGTKPSILQLSYGGRTLRISVSQGSIVVLHGKRVCHKSIFESNATTDCKVLVYAAHHNVLNFFN